MSRLTSFLKELAGTAHEVLKGSKLRPQKLGGNCKRGGKVPGKSTQAWAANLKKKIKAPVPKAVCCLELFGVTETIRESSKAQGKQLGGRSTIQRMYPGGRPASKAFEDAGFIGKACQWMGRLKDPNQRCRRSRLARRPVTPKPCASDLGAYQDAPAKDASNAGSIDGLTTAELSEQANGHIFVTSSKFVVDPGRAEFKKDKR